MRGRRELCKAHNGRLPPVITIIIIMAIIIKIMKGKTGPI